MTPIGARLVALWLGALAVGLVPTAGAATPSGGVVSVAGSGDGEPLVSMTARAVPLEALLAELGRRAGFEVAAIGGVARRVTIELSGRPLDEALRQLLQGESAVLLYGPADPGPPRLRKVVVIGVRAAAGPAMIAGTSDEFGSAAAPPDSEYAVPVTDADGPGLALESPEGSIEEATRLASHEDPRERAAAFESLGPHAADPRARQVLIQGLADRDSAIRQLAVELLAALVPDWPEAEHALV
ncbi:MAG TPA: HEAT repeat domain-containing protein, partial [Methylomirabilota bacterium]|nr:HEAT repeat domain-containing protein [Methylomirabilota bacterium]